MNGAATLQETTFAEEGRPPAQEKTILQQSSHPTALIFHFLFRTAAVLIYFFGGSTWTVQTFVLVVLMLALDFWVVKNVSGRLLVGLRWWNEIKEDGTSDWIFESRENRVLNAVDSRMFWWSLYIYVLIWGLFSILALIQLSNWMVLSVIAMVFNLANVIGYTKCEKDAKKKLASAVAGSGMLDGAINSFISNRIGSFFTRT